MSDTTIIYKQDLEQETNEKRDPAVDRNLGKMIGGQMWELLMKESMGGNAGVYKGKPCVCANFYYDERTGDLDFANGFDKGQTAPKGYFKLAFDEEQQIVEQGFDRGNPSLRAILTIAESRIEYNRIQKESTK